MPKNLIGGSEVLIALKAYCDGSGDAKRSEFIVLAGVAAEESVWACFEREWAQVLGNRSPVAPYLHMNEVVSGNGSFSDKNGWDETKREHLVRDCLFYAQTMDKLLFRSFVCSLDMKKYREIKASIPKFPSVPTLCNRYVGIQIFRWYLENFTTWKTPELYYFFDQNEKFIGPFQSMIKRRQKKSHRGLYNHWDIIKNIAPANMRITLPLQLSDMLAWAHHRRLHPHREGLKWSHLHTMTDAVIPFTRKEYGANDLDHIARWMAIGNVVETYFDDLIFPEHLL